VGNRDAQSKASFLHASVTHCRAPAAAAAGAATPRTSALSRVAM
jgi:hypothetical protein